MYFDQLGNTDGTPDVTLQIQNIINLEILSLRAKSPTSSAVPFSTTMWGIHFELELFDNIHIPVSVEIGALQVWYNYISLYGARDVRSLISCEGRACGRFRLWFESSGENAGISLHLNSSSAAIEQTA